MNPFFSIIIPSYNRGYILWKTITSIQNQTWPNWEVLVIDDGSTDNTKQIVNQFKDDVRIKYHYQKNSGPAVARNLGMSKSKGDIITFIDSDDPVYPHYLSSSIKQFYKFANKSFALSHCNFYYELYNNQGELISRKSAAADQSLTITLQNIYNWDARIAIGTGLFLKSDKFLGKAKWRSDIFPGDDIEYIMQLACIDPDGFTYIPQALFEYRQKYGGDGLCSNTTYAQWAEMFAKIYELHKNDRFMTDPHSYMRRIEKYKRLQDQLDNGKAIPPQYKYFPEHWKNKNLEPIIAC